MTGIETFNDVIEYIETHLSEEIRIEEMAKKARMSVYEFRRVFSFVAGIPLGEYIRRRRLSAAAAELTANACSVTEAAIKYGYDTPSSFSRAFKEFHGVSPGTMNKNGGPVRLFTKISFDLQVKGGQEIRYEIRDDTDFFICGHSDRSDLQDTECCEAVWDRFYKSKQAEEILQAKDGTVYAAYANAPDWVDCTIGARTSLKAGTNPLYVPSCRWACFPLNRTDDPFVNEFYKTILFGWLDCSGYKRVEELPNLEVYPTDMEDEGFLWEIRIPIKR